MEETRYEKELFDFEKPKRRLFKLNKIFPRAPVVISVGLERVVIISIGVIIAMVIVYAFGVEIGKSKRDEAVLETVRAPGEAPEETLRLAPSSVSSGVEGRSLDAAPGAKGAGDMPYTIAACTLANEHTAREEALRLKRKGFDAFVRQSGQYFQVCVGAYRDKNSTQSKKDLSRIRELYRDAYFRPR